MASSALRRWWPLAAVALLLALAALSTAQSSLRIDRLEQTERTPPPLEVAPDTRPPTTQPPLELAPAAPFTVPAWLINGAIGLAAIALVALLVVLARRLLRDLARRRRANMPAAAQASAEQTAEAVVAALDAGLVDLSDSDTDPRRAVIACWVRLEQAAAAAGMPRRVGDTPTDLVTRLLRDGTGVVSAEVLAAFAHVYREARYATHSVDEQMRAQARSALQRLRTELTAGVTS
ncbi:DUF4129 domain-containing protein [Micromonospora sp. NBC_01796]|uniref:DUF4129 domain-containing protein n=1 Tax=Micromonospora sp. NBC_01796 TaxID=2975987 RepID=UPI002DDAAC5C|nr:DUF4129 domain-containing protein [Micromonospora sp. NBC_01796]WSA87620.1 DUF4129 domain-containing protein [Micromonospora sp. NBC_01796]